MKNFIILVLFIPLIVLGQSRKIKITNGVTNKPVKEIYCYILKDYDKIIDVEHTNNKGVFTLNLSDLDSTSTYQINITDQRYNRFQQNINPFDPNPLTLKIYPNSSYAGKQSGMVYRYCMYTSFGDYMPFEPRSIQEITDSIRIKLEAHLIDRLGLNFYSNLELSCGQVVDLERLYIVEKNAKNYKWTPYSYYLCFSFKDSSKGIGRYHARIVLDKYGNVIDEIELPNIKDNPEKVNIIPLSDAKWIAKKNGFYNETTDISLSYDMEVGSITWCFEQSSYNSDHTMSALTLVIDAHSGEVLGKRSKGGIWCD